MNPIPRGPGNQIDLRQPQRIRKSLPRFRYERPAIESVDTLPKGPSARTFLLGLVIAFSASWTVAAEKNGPADGEKPGEEIAGKTTDPANSTDLPLDGRDGRTLALSRFRPRSMLRVDASIPRRAKYPVVDVHTHPKFRFRHSPERLDEFVQLMDDQNIALCISLDGPLGSGFDEHAKYLWTQYRRRFILFANIDWRGEGDPNKPVTWVCHQPGFARRVARDLAERKSQGVSGLKIFKQLGLGYHNPDGSLVRIDDPRWDPIWEACGDLELPVIIHTSDPAAFFLPIDETNERWEELHRRPEWSFFGEDFPSRNELLEARNRVIARHPQTTFIGAHVANNPEDLDVVGQWLDQYANLVVEISSRIGELGRQPYSARKFFLKYSDRILFGTDGPRPEARLKPYWRFLETSDEYFRYAENPFPPQGLWNIYGIGLPDEVLRKVYHQNAARLIPGVQEKLDAFRAAKR